MLTRFGKLAHVGWSRSEELWLEAIMEMGPNEQRLKELSELTGRSRKAIKHKLRAKQEAHRISLAQARLRPCVPVRGFTRIVPAPASTIRPLTRAELMGGK